jgi:putative multiple sugar transport system permease protein
MQTLIHMLKSNIRQYGMFIALILIMLLFQVLSNGILLKPLNVTNLILQNSYILVLAIGMVLVIITGHIDLSVGSVAAFIGAVSAILMVDMHVPFILAVIISLVLGALVGAWQGFWIAYVKIPSFIVTLAGMLLFRGLTMLVLEGQSVAPFPESFQKISAGFIPDLFGGGPYHNLTLAIGVILSAILVFNELRNRKTLKSYEFEVMPFGFFVAKMVAMVAIINVFTFVLAMYEGIPMQNCHHNRA